MNEVAQSPQASLEAHYTNDIKVRRPKLTEASAPNSLPSRVLFSDREATKKMQSINTDIYEGTKKEKQKNEFNKSLYFKIFGGVLLAAAAVAGIRKLIHFFRKS